MPMTLCVVLLLPWLLAGRKALWLTVTISICDTTLFAIWCYTVAVLWNVRALTCTLVAAAVGQAFSLSVGYFLLSWPCFLQHHVQSWRLRFCALPGLYACLIAVTAQNTTIGSRRGSLPAVCGYTLLLQAVLGWRKDLVAFLAFQTLPSRACMLVWKVGVVVLGVAVALLAVFVGLGLDAERAPARVQDIMAVVGGVEGLRLVCALLLMLVHRREDLTTMRL